MTRPATRCTTRWSQGVNPLPALPSLASRQDADDQPVHLGPAGGDHQHLVRLQHRPLTTLPTPPLGAGRRLAGEPRPLLAGGSAAPRWLAPRPGLRPAPAWACRSSGCCCALHPAALRLLPGARGLAAAVRPGTQWFTLTYLRQALTGSTAVAIVNSLWVRRRGRDRAGASASPSPGWRRGPRCPAGGWVAGGMWLALLLPSWLPAIGWERLVQQDGVMYRIGLDWPWVTHLIMGPFGVVLLLGLRCVPFSYLAITAALDGLGQEFEDAARVHGAGRLADDAADRADPRAGDHVGAGDRLRRVDLRLRRGRHAGLQLELLARHLRALRGDQQLPAVVPAGAPAMAWLLVAAVAIPLRPAGAGAARPVVRDLVRADAAGGAAAARRLGAVAAGGRASRCSS